MKKQVYPALLALLAAAFYAVSIPLSKLLLQHIAPTCLAALLYLGAGLGVGLLYAFHWKQETSAEHLTRQDLPYTLGMIALDILAPILLMLGVSWGSAANASLLSNFEIVATTLLALALFRERVSPKLWLAIGLITLSSLLLSFEGTDSFQFSLGSLLVLGATTCWGLENNCTRSISHRSTYQIVTLKGLCSGGGAFVVSRLLGEPLPTLQAALCAMVLGFVAYGLSIFLYVRAQRDLGAARTSAYYAVAPFVGTFLCLILTGEGFSGAFFPALAVMLVGTGLVVLDTLAQEKAA